MKQFFKKIQWTKICPDEKMSWHASTYHRIADKRADDSLNEAWVNEASLPPVLGKIITRAAADIRQAVFFGAMHFKDLKVKRK